MERPKIKPKLTGADKLVEQLSWVLLVLLTGSALYYYVNLPETIPTHFNISGEADGFGNRLTIFILPAIGIMLFTGITTLNGFPYLFNYAVPINERNAETQYRLATRMMRFIKLGILVLFNVLLVMIYLTATGVTAGISGWFLPLTGLLVVAPTAYFVLRSVKLAKRST